MLVLFGAVALGNMLQRLKLEESSTEFDPSPIPDPVLVPVPEDGTDSRDKQISITDCGLEGGSEIM